MILNDPTHGRERPAGRSPRRIGPGAAVGTLPLIGALLVIAACSAPVDEETSAPLPSDPLLIGVIPSQDVFRQFEGFDAVTQLVSSRIGVPIELKPLPRIGNIVENFREARLDGAFFGSFTYALAHEQLGQTVVVRPVMRGGSSTYHGLLIALREGPVTSVADLEGRRFAFVDRATLSGYLFPLALLAGAGVDDPARYFEEHRFSGAHEQAIRDVLDGRADAASVKNTELERLASTEPPAAARLAVLARSDEVPENGLALRADIDPRLAEALAEAFLVLQDDRRGRRALEQLGAERFIVTTDADYEPVYRYAREAGLDLATYDYHND